MGCSKKARPVLLPVLNSHEAILEKRAISTKCRSDPFTKHQDKRLAFSVTYVIRNPTGKHRAQIDHCPFFITRDPRDRCQFHHILSGRRTLYSRILLLRFPQTEVKKPIVCYLAKDYDLTFNILNAQVLPRKEGIMVLELSGNRKNFKEGVQYLKSQGVQVQNASQEIKRDEKRCTHCGACTAVCPTDALSIKRPEMEVVFDQSKCSICELCITACPVRVMSIRPTTKMFFE